jgi:CBS domain-containing protein
MDATTCGEPVIGLSDVDGLKAADLVTRASTLPVASTIGDLRGYFAASGSRRLAVIVDGDRYVGSLTPADVPDGVDATAAAADFAHREPVIHASRGAREARDAALVCPSARLPVVDEDGTLVGIVALNHRRDGFCGT